MIHAGAFGDLEALHALADVPLVVAVRGNNDGATGAEANAEQLLVDLLEVAMVKLGVEHLIVIHGHQYPQSEGASRTATQAVSRCASNILWAQSPSRS